MKIITFTANDARTNYYNTTIVRSVNEILEEIRKVSYFQQDIKLDIEIDNTIAKILLNQGYSVKAFTDKDNNPRTYISWHKNE